MRAHKKAAAMYKEAQTITAFTVYFYVCSTRICIGVFFLLLVEANQRWARVGSGVVPLEVTPYFGKYQCT